MDSWIIFLKILGSIYTVSFGIAVVSLLRTVNRPDILIEGAMLLLMIIILCSIWI